MSGEPGFGWIQWALTSECRWEFRWWPQPCAQVEPHLNFFKSFVPDGLTQPLRTTVSLQDTVTEQPTKGHRWCQEHQGHSSTSQNLSLLASFTHSFFKHGFSTHGPWNLHAAKEVFDTDVTAPSLSCCEDRCVSTGPIYEILDTKDPGLYVHHAGTIQLRSTGISLIFSSNSCHPCDLHIRCSTSELIYPHNNSV